ncbi:MAG: hypothetical protein MHMPM18_002366 [Marteilia pararefringens]
MFDSINKFFHFAKGKKIIIDQKNDLLETPLPKDCSQSKSRLDEKIKIPEYVNDIVQKVEFENVNNDEENDLLADEPQKKATQIKYSHIRKPKVLHKAKASAKAQIVKENVLLRQILKRSDSPNAEEFIANLIASSWDLDNMLSNGPKWSEEDDELLMNSSIEKIEKLHEKFSTYEIYKRFKFIMTLRDYFL